MADNSDNTPKAAAQPISDVAHPGKTAPSPNSKSVILPHRTMVADPMVSAAPAPAPPAPAQQGSAAATPTAPTDPSSRPLAGKSSKSTIQPLASSPKLEATINTAADEVPAESVPDKKEDKPTSSPKAGLPDQPRDPAADSDAEEFAKTKKEEAIQKLIVSKQYFLPINSAEKQRSKRFVTTGVLLSLLLVVAWADIALDAGLVQIGNLKAITHFFN